MVLRVTHALMEKIAIQIETLGHLREIVVMAGGPGNLPHVHSRSQNTSIGGPHTGVQDNVRVAAIEGVMHENRLASIICGITSGYKSRGREFSPIIPVRRFWNIHASLAKEATLIARPDPIDSGRQFVESQFPEAVVVFVMGSFLRGQGTPTSDLDIVIITDRDDAPFRASYLAHGWPIEAFVHTRESWRWYFASDAQSVRIPLPSMCAEGVIIRDHDGLADEIKREARTLIARGPKPLSLDEIEDLRYALTDALDDFIGVPSLEEGIFAAVQVAERSVQLRLRLAGHWIGAGKWIPRTLRQVDPAKADELRDALERYCRHGDKRPLIRFAEQALQKVGGRLFAGYHRAGRLTPPEGS